MDNWGTSFNIEKNVWYDGYALVSMNSVAANSTYSPSFGLRQFENMFYLDSYFYAIAEKTIQESK